MTYEQAVALEEMRDTEEAQRLNKAIKTSKMNKSIYLVLNSIIWALLPCIAILYGVIK